MSEQRMQDFPEGPFLSPPLSVDSKSGTGTHFQPIQEQEAEYISELRGKIRKLRGDMGLADRVLVLKNAPGFAEFLTAVRRKRDLIRRDMETCRGENSELRMLQGRTQALTSIIAIVSDTEKVKANLAKELDRLQELEKATVRQDDKRVRPAQGG